MSGFCKADGCQCFAVRPIKSEGEDQDREHEAGGCQLHFPGRGIEVNGHPENVFANPCGQDKSMVNEGLRRGSHGKK